MPKEIAQLLRETVARETPNLLAISDSDANNRPGAQTENSGETKPTGWSRKQELGHLIDSATNNHIRFVLASIDGEFRGLGYAQDKWVDAHGYNEMEWRDLIDLWRRYNELLAHLIERVPDDRMASRCVIGWGVVTLRFVMEDYIIHMQHHLDHVLARTV